MTETKDSHMDKRKVILIILGILILLLLILTSTWAFYQIDNTDSSTKTTGTINLDCIKIEYVEEGSLSPDYAYPIKDDYAKEHIKPVKVRITNTCEANLEEINYSLVLTTLKKDDNNITSDKIRLNSKRALNLTLGNEPESYDEFLKPTYLDELSELSNEYSKEALSNDILNREKDGVKVFEGYSIIDTKVIDENFIKNNSESVYEIQLWIDYYEGDKEVYNGSSHDGSYDNSTQNKTFVSALSVVANPYEKHSTNFLNIMNYLRGKDPEKHLSENLIGDMYRYQGLPSDTINNYICLGTDCSEQGDDLYRIIGINADGTLKVIKKTAIEETHNFSNDYSVGIEWPDTNIYKTLNDSNTGFISKLSTDLKSIIVNYNWKYGTFINVDNFSPTGKTTKEINENTLKEININTNKAYIGLMNIGDYCNSYKPDGEANCVIGTSDSIVHSWLNMQENDSSKESVQAEVDGSDPNAERIMTYFGIYEPKGDYSYFRIDAYGKVMSWRQDRYGSIRPVFYLSNEIELFGEGTIKEPFKIITKDSDNNKVYGFSYTGDYQTFSVPEDGTYKIELWGASGGSSLMSGVVGSSHGKGAYTSGEIILKKDDKLYLYVGGAGENGILKADAKGGYNGGGIGTWDMNDDESGGGGGGATDIRLTASDWNDFNSLKSRIMVAAGGGGGSWSYATVGSGGGISADKPFESTVPGTQTSGYAFGYGQNGEGKDTGSNGIGGGGGGYYGGGTCNIIGESAGAGGSSFISGHKGCNAISSSSTLENIEHLNSPNHYSNYIFNNTVMIDGNGYNWTDVKGELTQMPNYNGGTMVGNTGHGYARITKIK